MSAGFEEWWESLGESVPHKQDEFARMVWNAALRRAAEICRELDPRVDPYLKEDKACADMLTAVLKHHFGQCAQAIEREIAGG